ncbi:unnamed protein product [Cryptosporidium hominis]|uniref:Uncharacterized protein n=1 Tax=Cryptosporidium hominis TaxID=237895 RepID=A0A0S4TKK7_CRYHO|nr:hypothetical protein ChTU502y2012_405g0265 [Cryptosporidium hominis]PPA64441.1 hypothetical protein ChUKH1_07090 [Cryptosporidium hominis]CUV07908.1 unnamed protein product [Cryptosporidium hominis]
MRCQQLIFLLFMFIRNVKSFENGLLRLVIEFSQHSLNGSLDDFVSSSAENYFSFENPQQSVSCDRVFYSPRQYIDQNPPSSEFITHIPRESKSPAHFLFYTEDSPFRSRINMSQTHFPRRKHFNKNLPKLPLEPYQRIMTFAIEICMIPSIWYLELIHCMHFGMAPFFSGMLMSYTLQDVIGSAIKTMGYLDESFTIENCYRSVSSVTDEQINANFQEICESMSQCLLSNQFSSDPYIRLKEEFQQRIDNAYSNIEGQEKVEQHKNYARHSLLLSLSSKTINFSLPDPATEKNFLIIRAMILSMTYLVNKFIPVEENTISERMSKITKFIYSMLFSQFKYYMKMCLISFPAILGSKSKNFQEIIELYCKEFLSFGFIDETVKIEGDDLEAFNKAILPSRVLDPAYASVIPSLINGASSQEDLSWLSFSSVGSIENIGVETGKKKRPKTTKYFKTASKNSITKTRSAETNAKKKSGFTKITKMFTNRKTRISGLITSHLGSADQ